MKSKNVILFFNLISLVFINSVYASGSHKNHMHKDHKKMEMEEAKKTGRKSLNDASKKTVITMLEKNEKLHAAFFTYDAKAVEKNATELKNAMDAIKDEEVSKLLKFSKTKLSEIKASNDREVNNQNYHIVSSALIYIVNMFDVGPKYNAYSCPMVKKKWVQNSKKMAKVHNPYAPEMPHCGTQDSHYK